MVLFSRPKEPPHIISDIPNHIWVALTLDMQEILFAIDGCVQGRYSVEEMQARLYTKHLIAAVQMFVENNVEIPFGLRQEMERLLQRGSRI